MTRKIGNTKVALKRFPKGKLSTGKLKKKVNILRANTGMLENVEVGKGVKKVEEIFEVEDGRIRLGLEYQKVMREKLIQALKNSMGRKERVRGKPGSKGLEFEKEEDDERKAVTKSMVDLCDPVRYDKDQKQIEMFYSSFKEFINLQDALNMDDNIGRGCGFEGILDTKNQSQVCFLNTNDIKNIGKRNLNSSKSLRWNKSNRISINRRPATKSGMRNSNSLKDIKFIYNRNIYDYEDMDDPLIKKVPLKDLFTQDKDFLFKTKQHK